MSVLSPVAKAALRHPVGRVRGDGITATVFGSTGFLGRYVCAHLGLNGNGYVVPYRGDETEVSHLRVSADLGNVAQQPFHPRDRDSIFEAVEGSDIVINLIGKHYQTKHILPWWINYTYDDVHVDVARTIAEVAKEAGVPRMVHVSSLLAQPNSPSEWAASKFRGEVAVRKAFPDANIVRPSNMFGPEDRLLVWIGNRLNYGGVPVVDNGDAVIQPVFVNDVAKAIYHITQDETIQGKTFEFVGDEEFTYKELADYVFDITKRNPRLVNLPLPVAQAIGYFCEQFPDPKFTRDWATRLSLNEVKTSDLPGLRELDVEPTPLEKEAPNFLLKFNPGGHFQEVSGFTAGQSEAILQVMKDAMADSLEAQSRILATKSEHVELKAELSERVFNSTLKFDIAQRHSRELLERDFNTLKQDIRMLEKIDFDKIRMEIAELEKKFLLQKQAEDETLNELRLSMEKVEKRMLQYAVGFAGTIMAV
ncbi:NADH dehydrogenase, partial [Phytophthora palmivora]